MAWAVGAGMLVAIGLGYANYNWHKTVKMPYEHIANAELKALDGTDNLLMGKDIWKDNGAVVMEAAGLSSLKGDLDNLGIKLVGIVHERKGTEEFKSFLKGPLFLDEKRIFYGPKERWMGLSGFFRVGVWKSILRAKGKNISGNFAGEGRILGGLFVVSERKGIVFQYDEKEFGDHADVKDVLAAAKKLVE
eukprot:gene5329-499_t